MAYVSYSRFLEMIDYNIQNIHLRIIFGKKWRLYTSAHQVWRYSVIYRPVVYMGRVTCT